MLCSEGGPPLRTPERRYVYQGPIVDGSRWDHFVPRPDDVFVCTLGKNGTTWMQAICALLIFQTPELEFNPAERSPWFDSTFSEVEDDVALLESQAGRRVIKTHTALDGIPFFPGCTYITVYRDPRDAFFSMRNHIDNFKREFPNMPKLELEDAFRAWVAGPRQAGVELPTLASAMHHLESFLEFRERPEIWFFHYADLKRDLRGQMQRVATALGVEVEDETLASLVEAASFANMKRNAERFVPGASNDAWHDTARFLHRGANGQWRDGALSEQALQLFERRLDELIGADLARWLKAGGTLPG